MDLIFAVGWEGFIIPLIAFVIWVISTAAGNKNAPQNPKVGAKNLGPGNRAPVSDLERFFQEAKQRRAKPEPVPKAKLFAEPPAPKVKQRSPVKNAGSQIKFVPPAEPFLFNLSESDVVPLEPGAVKVVAGEPALLPPSPATITKDSMRKFGSKTNPLIAEALALLKGPKVIGSALVLQEILQPPLCLRRRLPNNSIR